MAFFQRAPGLAILAAVALASGSLAQLWLTTLQQAGSRRGPDLAPAFEGQELAITGQVSARPTWAGALFLVPIQDSAEYGLFLQGQAWQFAGLEPGDWIQARGVIGRRGAMPVLLPREIQKLRGAAPPTARQMSLAEANSVRYSGILAGVDGTVMDSTHTNEGDVLSIRDSGHVLGVLLPRSRPDSPGLEGFRAGDLIHVTGVLGQFRAAHRAGSSFDVLVDSPAAVVFTGKTWLIPPWLLVAALSLIAPILVIWWFRERHLSRQRIALRAFYKLAEDIVASNTAAEIVMILNSAFSKMHEGMHAAVYIYNRAHNALDLISAGPAPATLSIRLDGPVAGLAAGLALCFRNRTLLTVPDVRRSPFLQQPGQKNTARSVLFAPMFAQDELVGVMQAAHYSSLHYFHQDEQAAMQHVANQAGAALHAQEQKTTRERLFRTEKLAAASQLISGIAGELRAPLAAIGELTGAIKSRHDTGVDSKLDLIEEEAGRASEIVGRLAAFGQTEQPEAEPVDIHGLLTRLLRARTQERKPGGAEIHPQFVNQRVLVLGSHAQLEQVFLNILIHAERAAAQAPDIPITISTSLLARIILIEIGCHAEIAEVRKSDPFENNGGESAALGLGLARGVIQSHGGDIRFVRAGPTQSRFEVELPVMDAPPVRPALPAANPRAAGRQLTVLVVEPDVAVQKQLMVILSRRGDRAVPVASAEEGADLAQRLRFDLTLCAVRLPGLNWVEFFERVRKHTGTFVLLTQGYDPDLVKAFQNNEGFVLSKPVDENPLNRICDAVAQHNGAAL